MATNQWVKDRAINSDCSLVGFSQGLSASQQCFSLTTNQHQPGLSAQKPTSEHAHWLKEDPTLGPKVLKGKLEEKYYIYMSYYVVWDSRQMALDEILGG